jgi:hypothetical protein
MKKLIIAVIVLLSGATIHLAQTKSSKNQNDVCYKWQTQVDPSLERIIFDKSILPDDEILEGIGCLLKLKGKTKKARFTGATRTNYKSADQYKPPKHPASVEIAALYYISYLFYENWEHANSVSLFDQESKKLNSNTKKSVKKAYKSYQKWFEKVKEIGLEKAREQKLDPLQNSGIAWS